MNKNLEKVLVGVIAIATGYEIGRTIQNVRICIKQKKLIKLEEEKLRLLEEEKKAKQLAKEYEEAYERAKKQIELAKQNDTWTKEVHDLTKRCGLIIAQIESEQGIDLS